MAVDLSHLNYSEGCEFCKKTIQLFEWRGRYKILPYFLPCCLLNQFQHQMTEYQELLEACITLSPESVQGSFDALWDAFHELKFSLLYKNENDREFFGPIIKSLLETSQDTWSFGKLWRVQNIVNEVITGSSMLDFLMCPTLPNGNTFQFSPYVFTLCVFSKYNEADIKKFIDIIYRQHNHSNGWIIPIICYETEDSATINSIKQIPIIHITEPEIDCSAFCMFIAKPYEYMRIGIVVLSIINFHYQSYYRLWSSLLGKFKLIKWDRVTNFEYLTNRIVYLIWDHFKLEFSCLITHRKYGRTDNMEQYAFQNAIIPVAQMYKYSDFTLKIVSQYIMLIFVPRTNFLYIFNFFKKVYALIVNFFSIYWYGGYTFTYQHNLDRLYIEFLEEKYWRDIIASFFIKIGERYDSIETTNDDPTLEFMESLPGFNDMLNKFREIMNSLTNFSKENITTKTDGRVAFLHLFSNDNNLDFSEYFSAFERWQLIDLETITVIINNMQQDPLNDTNLEDAVRNFHFELRIENKKRIDVILASTNQEVNISKVCFVY